MKRWLLVLVFALASHGALGQTCPTRPVGDNTNACASTAFVQAAVNGSIELPNGQILIGSAGGFAAPQTMSQDCTISNTGVMTCAKTNNVAFASSATTDTTNASNISSGSLALGRIASINNNTILGNVSGGPTAPSALTATQLTTLCNAFTTSLSGCAPASGGGTTNFLRADGSWSAPPSSPTTPYFAQTHLNGTNQTWVPPNPNKYHLFLPAAAPINQNGIWQSCCGSVAVAFKPPNGTTQVQLIAQIWATSGVSASGNWVAKWIKNATIDGSNNIVTGTELVGCAGIGAISDAGAGTAIMQANCYDDPADGDYYNLFMFIDSVTLGTTTISIDGNPAHTAVQMSILR